MTKQKKTQVSVQKIRCKIASGKKGKLRVQKSMRAFRTSRLANLASKREQQPLESPDIDQKVLQIGYSILYSVHRW